MKLRISAIIVICLFILLVSPWPNKNIEMDYYEIVTKGFQVANAEKSALIISGWAKISLRTLSANEIKQKIQYLNHQLNLPSQIEVKNYNNQIDFQRGAYLQIIARLNPEEIAIENYYYTLNKILSAYPQSQLAITIEGTYNGRLSEMQINKIVGKVFQSVNVRNIDGIKTDNLISYSGYSNVCGEHIIIANKETNFHLALRYHNLDQKTYLNIGAPLIFQEY